MSADATPKDGAAAPVAEGDRPMTIWEHLDELRKRLFRSAIAIVVTASLAWSYHEELLAILAQPFCDSWRAAELPGTCALNFSSPAGAFTSYFQISLIAGLVASAPFVFYQLWAFIAPGLYAREKRYVIPFVLTSTLLFVGGGWFCLKAAFPITFDYFLGLSGNVAGLEMRVVPTIMMDDYVSFVAQMLLGFGLVFELPLVLFFLSLVGIVNYLQLIHYGRYFIVGAFIVAAVLTPPDVTSQLVMAIPMVVLYGASIGLAYFFGKPPTDAQRAHYREKRLARKAARG